jgi:hypothetical protein
LSNQNLAEVIRGQISHQKAKNGVAELNAREKAFEQREIGLEVTLFKAELESENQKSELFQCALVCKKLSI